MSCPRNSQFVAAAVAEKVAALRTAEFFAGRKGRADWAAFERLMAWPGGEPAREGDETTESPLA